MKKQRVSIKSPQIQTLIASLEKKFFELIQNNEHKIRWIQKIKADSFLKSDYVNKTIQIA